MSAMASQINSVSNRRKSEKRLKLRVTGLCVRNSPGTREFPAQMASNAENVPIWWRHNEWTSMISQFKLVIAVMKMSWDHPRTKWTNSNIKDNDAVLSLFP